MLVMLVGLGSRDCMLARFAINVSFRGISDYMTMVYCPAVGMRGHLTISPSEKNAICSAVGINSDQYYL